MRGQPFPVAGALDDDLVAGVGQAVQGAVAQDGVIQEAEPFFDGPVAGDDEAGGPVSVEDAFVKIGGLLGGQPVETQVIEDEQVGGEEGPEGAVHRVVDPGNWWVSQVEMSDPGIVWAWPSADSLTLTVEGSEGGSSTVTVHAQDSEGNAVRDTFAVTVTE